MDILRNIHIPQQYSEVRTETIIPKMKETNPSEIKFRRSVISVQLFYATSLDD